MKTKENIFIVIAACLIMMIAGCDTGTGNSGKDDIEHSVTFKYYNGDTDLAVMVKSGGKVTAPTAPQREGYNFGGWHEEAACENLFDFNTKIEEDITLHAYWNDMRYLNSNALASYFVLQNFFDYIFSDNPAIGSHSGRSSKTYKNGDASMSFTYNWSEYDEWDNFQSIDISNPYTGDFVLPDREVPCIHIRIGFIEDNNNTNSYQFIVCTRETDGMKISSDILGYHYVEEGHGYSNEKYLSLYNSISAVALTEDGKNYMSAQGYNRFKITAYGKERIIIDSAGNPLVQSGIYILSD